ncbi:MAG: hypothetical protein EOO01_14625 [Chitinophagaceae bacterium]|nr:MAG: hypothetical protein EOO01_14625 [Chitinophagaceae bacterium]
MQVDKDEILIREKLIPLFQQLNGNEKGSWGKMNAWQAVEHLADFFDASSNKVQYEIVTPEEYLPKYMEFLQSNKEFRENTKAPANVLGEEPAPVKFSSFRDALQNLEGAVNGFFNFFQNAPSVQTNHPVFGKLNYKDWLKLHGKHVRHHLRQFGLNYE